MSKKYFIFSDSDLDGICSYITLSWFLAGSPTIPYKLSTVTHFKTDLLEWLKTNKLSDYDKVFILDMDISNVIDMVDKKNVVVIDHHRSHVSHADKYLKAKTIIKEYTSATRLIYDNFKTLKPLTKAQQTLVLLADDYDCYALKVPTSYDLHVVYYQTQNSAGKSKQEKFIESFGEGFFGFTSQQKAIAQLHRAEVQKTIDSLDVYGGIMNVQHQDVTIYSCVCERAINEVADHLIRKLGADVAIVVNPNSKKVSFRRKAGVSTVDMSKLAEDLTEGGGHEYAAGGNITDKFMAFTSLLRPIS